MIVAAACKRNPAHGTEGGSDRCHQFAAGGADVEIVGIRDEAVADMAERGKDGVEGRPQQVLQHAGSESEVGIDHYHPQVRPARPAVYDRRDTAETVR